MHRNKKTLTVSNAIEIIAMGLIDEPSWTPTM